MTLSIQSVGKGKEGNGTRKRARLAGFREVDNRPGCSGDQPPALASAIRAGVLPLARRLLNKTFLVLKSDFADSSLASEWPDIAGHCDTLADLLREAVAPFILRESQPAAFRALI